MFNFFKKSHPKTESKQKSEIKVTLTSSQIEQIEQDINQLLQQIDQTDDAVILATLCEKAGLLYCQLDRADFAIEYLEKSLQHKKSIGEGYKALMNLYNHKRADAAQNGSIDDIDFWMNKIDSMRNIAKQVTVQRD
ncbi:MULTISPECIES: tetratricopeptide repeat protein [unclassified Gilliamella]|uniref:tetratricopeptide repeat protein n=1 Tax=unclassified Gilliamella TaxID=2685620 RepID=UPI00130A0E72|nr:MULTISPECIES: tetratricopeptide repeat protein [unclassified Gilliamella]MWP48232.1 tetratricopeptide repeat protein [Gilliamella sp. Lep-s35]MWP68152.1 tetratricopeptide repeat protein [Gilliamella sp. Lep-s5]MWP76372.1 tetratricopeptide repeat protein [Gilliamella sp. Lep-s21]